MLKIYFAFTLSVISSSASAQSHTSAVSDYPNKQLSEVDLSISLPRHLPRGASALIDQQGDGHIISLRQTGNDNTAILVQSGDHNAMTATQTGDGNRLDWKQIGSNLPDLRIVQSGSDDIRILQVQSR